MSDTLKRISHFDTENESICGFCLLRSPFFSYMDLFIFQWFRSFTAIHLLFASTQKQADIDIYFNCLTLGSYASYMLLYIFLFVYYLQCHKTHTTFSQNRSMDSNLKQIGLRTENITQTAWSSLKDRLLT